MSLALYALYSIDLVQNRAIAFQTTQVYLYDVCYIYINVYWSSLHGLNARMQVTHVCCIELPTVIELPPL